MKKRGQYCAESGPCMKKFIQKIDNAVCSRLLNMADGRIDKRICGQSLVKYVPSISRDDKNGIGGTGSQSTHYALLKRVFSHAKLKPDDTFIDVGCGKGRVLAFLVKENCPCPIYGIEYNEEVGRIAAEWSTKYEQVNIIIGDALRLDYDRFTVLSLARSFLPKTFLAFVEQLERTLTHPVTLIYWYDQQSAYYLKNRPGWTMITREIVKRIHGIRIARWPQGFSIWRYNPDIVKFAASQSTSASP